MAGTERITGDEVLAQVGHLADSGPLLVHQDPGRADGPTRSPGAVSGLVSGPGPGPSPGQQWSGYLLDRRLGRGGMAEVFVAHAPDGAQVALKILADSGDPERLARFAAEAAAAGRIDSPGVVRTLASGILDGRCWLAMELIDGPTLAALIRQRAQAGAGFTPVEAAGLAHQAAGGLAAAHACRLVHRDIKPGNLLLTGEGRLKIADFGLVRNLDTDSLTRTGTILGTPQYLAPEQGRGLPASPASDVYSLGIVLYELLTGRLPFTGESVESLIFQHNYAEPPLPQQVNPNIPHDLQAICLLCLQKDPARRFADGAALAQDLERVLAGLAPQTAVFAPGRLDTGAAVALRAATPWRRRWWPFLAAGAAVAVIVLGAWRWQEQRYQDARDLRQRLTSLALAAPVAGTAASDLEHLAGLAGADDPVVRIGRAKLARIAELAERIEAAIAAPGGAASCSMVQVLLAQVVEEVGPDGDPRLARWSAWLAQQGARLADLRARLAPRLHGLDLCPRALARELAPDLEPFFGLAPADDPDRLAWQALLQRSRAAEDEARLALARLDDPAPLAEDLLAPMNDAWARLVRLAPDAVRPGWRQRLDQAAAAIAQARQVLARIKQGGLDAPAERQALAAALAILVGHAAISPAEERAWRQAQAATVQELASLRDRLAVLDLPRSLPPDTGALLARYEAMAGFTDARGQAWRQRFEEIRRLELRLAGLDQAGEPPAQAAADVQRLAELVGSDDPAVRRWQARLLTIDDLRREIGRQLARPGPRDARLAADLDHLADLIGAGHPHVMAWRSQLAEQDALAQRLDQVVSRLVLSTAEIAARRADLQRYHQLAGADPRSGLVERRLAELAGPGHPAWAAAAGHDDHGPWCDLLVDGVRARLRWIPPQQGWMGSPDQEDGRRPDEALVAVALSRGFWLAETECDQALYAAVTGAWPARQRDPAAPVESITAAEAERFCRGLGERAAGAVVRLPSEAEWELAMRAGGRDPWGGIPAAQVVATVIHAGHGLEAPRRAGSGPANALGLRDGPGNVWEWCAGTYGPTITGDPAVDPLRLDGRERVARGGSWGDPLASCRLARRLAVPGDLASTYLGFRFLIAGGLPP